MFISEGNVFMFDAPPPYSGIGPDRPPFPAGQFGGQVYPNVPAQGGLPPSAPPAYQEAPELPKKQ